MKDRLGARGPSRKPRFEAGQGNGVMSPSRKRLVTAAWREFLVRGRPEAGLSLTELARICGIGPSAIWQLIEHGNN